MDRPLFVYGMLRDPDLLGALLGRMLDRRNIVAAAAPGFAVVLYPDRVYPALVRAPGAVAEGLMLFGITPFELDVLDAYEGAEYRRDIIAVIVEEELHEAEVYIPTVAIAAGGEAWSFSLWQESHKPRVLIEAGVRAADIRARLIAVRPN